MMRAICMALALSALSCSSGSSSDMGGGQLSGVLQGAAFNPAEGGAVVIPPGNCDTSFYSALILGFSATSGLCTYAQEAMLCDARASDTILTVGVVDVGTGAQTPVGPGTYTIGGSSSRQVTASFTKTDATCTDSVPGTVTASGTVTLSTITASRVAGSVDLTFSDGSHAQGSFDVALCSVTVDFCGVISGTCTCSTMSCCI